jgi:hypothetical protein
MLTDDAAYPIFIVYWSSPKQIIMRFGGFIKVVLGWLLRRVGDSVDCTNEVQICMVWISVLYYEMCSTTVHVHHDYYLCGSYRRPVIAS